MTKQNDQTGGPTAGKPTLLRALGLPMLTFYGLGVTIGAGIFALIGELSKLAGDHAPLSFLVAGVIAGVSGFSYAKLSSAYPRTAGEAIYVKLGLGAGAGRFVGLAVSITGIITSAVLALAFSGYLQTLVPLPIPVLAVGVLVIIAVIAWIGVRESVAVAAVITVLEVGTLLVIAVTGAPLLADGEAVARAVVPPPDLDSWSIVLSASVIAFFAFIGFEDIVNMAEETVNPERNMPWAIFLTLISTLVLYLTISLIAIVLPDREAMENSTAPLATAFGQLTGGSGAEIAVMATIAIVNGILVQMIMASRVIYGMANEQLLPAALGTLDPKRRTPARAIALVTAIIAALALLLPLVDLAKASSVVVLLVFTTVNIALWRIGGRSDAPADLVKWRWWGLMGAALAAFLLVAETTRLIM